MHVYLLIFLSLLFLKLGNGADSDAIMRVMVTGGAGFIGSHAALRLLEGDYHVTIVVCFLCRKFGGPYMDVLNAYEVQLHASEFVLVM